MTNRVCVIDAAGQRLAPCTAKRARRLRDAGKAKRVYHAPYTIQLVHTVENPTPCPLEIRLDPGSKTTGIAVVATYARGDVVIWAGEIHHRGHQITSDLEKRAAARRNRRSRKWYRRPKFRYLPKGANGYSFGRADGWLPPSLMSRVYNVETWAKRLMRWMPITSIAVETVRFDMQKLRNPEIAGVEYQHGTLFGTEVREYVLRKWGHECAYCGAQNCPLELEHILAKSCGGSDAVSNLTLACVPCNKAKDNLPIEVFLKRKPERLARIQKQRLAPLRDAAAVNATRYAIGDRLKALELPVSFWSGGRTKFNRTSQGYDKAHWLDAACVGDRGDNVALETTRPLQIRAAGHGTRQRVTMNKHGFPRSAARARAKRVHDFQVGDYVTLCQPAGKYRGVHQGHLVSVRARGDFDLRTRCGLKITAPHHRYTRRHRDDGYRYA
ncbi:MAG: RNA-guided endonuclease IscB [Gammaproteobacteria bacterium]